MRIELEQQVIDFVRSLPPEPRQALQRGLKKLEGRHPPAGGQAGNFLPAAGAALPHHLSLLRHREAPDPSLYYAAPRNIIYEVFAQHLRELL